jgi:myo-inositol-1(or 4)-monophosphatase
MTNTADVVLLRDVALSLAREAGDMALAGRRKGPIAASTKSSSIDMVTEFDKASEKLITHGLSTLRPHDGIVGEEGAQVNSSTGIVWHIDPIDGTTNFLFDVPMWAVSIGAVDEHGPVAGAVYVPALGEMFSAARGCGATVNETPLRVRDNSSVNDALIATGFSYDIAQRPHHAQRVSAMLNHVRDIRRMGAAAIDLCFVAAGRIDAYFEENLNSWDLVAGQIIVTEAGGVVSNFAGGTVDPQQVLASSSSLHQQMVSLIAECGRE